MPKFTLPDNVNTMLNIKKIVITCPDPAQFSSRPSQLLHFSDISEMDHMTQQQLTEPK